MSLNLFGYVKTHRVRWSARHARLWGYAESLHRHQSWHNLCLSFVAHCYGFESSGVALYGVQPWAINLWNVTPRAYRHHWTTNPPIGALVFWRGRNGGTGHVAYYYGSGLILTNDLGRDGFITVEKIGDVRAKWGLIPVGWIEPHFGKGNGTNPY